MTRDEFILYYTTNTGISTDFLRELNLIALPCSCEEEGCQGWQMRHLYSFVCGYDFERIPEPYLSELREAIKTL